MNRCGYFVSIVAFAVICNVFSQETATIANPNQLNNILQSFQNGEVLKKIQESVQNINTAELQQKAKEFQEAVKPVLDKIQNATQPFFEDIQTKIFRSNSSTNLIDGLKSGVAPLIQAFNSSASKFSTK